MNRTTVDIDDVEFAVDYCATPGLHGSPNAPEEPAELEIIGVYLLGFAYYPGPVLLSRIEDQVWDNIVAEEHNRAEDR